MTKWHWIAIAIVGIAIIGSLAPDDLEHPKPRAYESEDTNDAQDEQLINTTDSSDLTPAPINFENPTYCDLLRMNYVSTYAQLQSVDMSIQAIADSEGLPRDQLIETCDFFGYMDNLSK